jgi:hypothetical protein
MKYSDLFELSEDSRIQAIGEAASTGNTVGVVLEKDELKKIERYIRKVTERYPGIVVLKRIDGPTPLLVTIKFGKKLQ